MKNVHEITDDLYKQYDFHRLLRIFQRYGSQRDELKRKETAANSSDSEHEIDFSVDFSHGKKRPTASVITTTITKRKRASGVSV